MFDTALLVDDDKITNFLQKRLVEKVGLAKKVMVAKDGKAALDTLQEMETTVPILVLLDLNMPGMNGFEFLEKLEGTSMGANLTIFVCTTSTNPKDLAMCAKFSISGFFNKPLNENKLKELIQQC